MCRLTFLVLRSLYKSPLTVENIEGSSVLTNYVVIYKNSAKLDFEISRPDKNDTTVLLCIAGTFTTLDKNDIDGLYIHKGNIYHQNRVNKRIGGAIKIANGEGVIFPTDKGSILTDSLLSDIAGRKGSLFQQIQMVVNGKAATFKDTVLFQCRGIAILKNGKTVVVESTVPITLKTFANDMVDLGVNDLLYTDMGVWDEGWYRNPSNGFIVMIGMDHSQTNQQCNWVVFRK